MTRPATVTFVGLFVLLVASACGSRSAKGSVAATPEKPQVYSIATDGSDRRSLGVTGYLLSRSPSGRIAFAPSENRLAVMNDDGTGRRLLLHLHADHWISMTPSGWSPDGERLAVSVATGCSWESVCTASSVWVVDAATGAHRRVFGNADGVAWSPDGTRLAFTNYPYPVYGAADHAPNKPHFVFTAPINGGKRRPIAEGYRPSWLPDRTRIVFEGERAVYTDVRDNTWTGVNLISVAGGRSRLLANADLYWAASPDGSKLAFQPFPEGRLAIVAISGGKPRYVTPEGPYAYSPVWSPDGSELAWLEGEVGRNVTRLLVGRATAAGTPRVLASRPGGGSIETPLFSADGTRVLYSVER